MNAANNSSFVKNPGEKPVEYGEDDSGDDVQYEVFRRRAFPFERHGLLREVVRGGVLRISAAFARVIGA